MIVNKYYMYEMIIVLYLSTILTEQGLDKNMKIKPLTHWNSSLGMHKIKKKS